MLKLISKIVLGFLVQGFIVLCFVVQGFAQSEPVIIFENNLVPDTLGADLLTNGNMELNSNWTAYQMEGGDISEQSTTQKHGGSYSWHISVDAGDEGIYSDDISVTAGTIYYISYWVYSIDGALFSMTGYYGNYSTGYDPKEPPIGVWTNYIKQVTASGTGSEKFLIHSLTTATEFYIDDVTIRPKL